MARATALLADQALPGLEQDPQPAPEKRGPGRPRGSRTTTAPKKAAGNRGRIAVRTTKGTIMSKAEKVAKVREDAMTYAELAVAGWELRDPQCAGVWYDRVMLNGREVERIEAFVDKVVTIIARNEKILDYAVTTSWFGEVAAVLHLVYPVGKAIWTAHGPNGAGHQDQDGGQVDHDRYPAWQGAPATG